VTIYDCHSSLILVCLRTLLSINVHWLITSLDSSSFPYCVKSTVLQWSIHWMFLSWKSLCPDWSSVDKLALSVLYAMDPVNVSLSSVCTAAQSGSRGASSTWQFTKVYFWILRSHGYYCNCHYCFPMHSMSLSIRWHGNMLRARSTLNYSVRGAC
jgi:hypothetical protein